MQQIKQIPPQKLGIIPRITPSEYLNARAQYIRVGEMIHYLLYTGHWMCIVPRYVFSSGVVPENDAFK